MFSYNDLARNRKLYSFSVDRKENTLKKTLNLWLEPIDETKRPKLRSQYNKYERSNEELLV